MGNKINPGNFDCYHNALPEEPMFILLGRDPTAAQRVRDWAAARVAVGKNKNTDEQIVEAYRCAAEMDAYYAKRQANILYYRQREAEVQRAMGLLVSRSVCECPVICDSKGCRPLNCKGQQTPGCRADPPPHILDREPGHRI